MEKRVNTTSPVHQKPAHSRWSFAARTPPDKPPGLAGPALRPPPPPAAADAAAAAVDDDGSRNSALMPASSATRQARGAPARARFAGGKVASWARAASNRASVSATWAWVASSGSPHRSSACGARNPVKPFIKRC